MFFLAFFWSCTACNSNDQKNDTDSFAINDAETDTDSVKKDADLTDSSHDNDADIQDKDISVNDDDDGDDWPPKDDKELPDLADDPYGTFYSDYDKNVAYEYYGDFDVVVEDPDEVRKLWDKLCALDQCMECEVMPFDLCSENYPFEPQIIDGPYPPSRKDYYGKLPQITDQCDALLTPLHWETDNLSNEKIFHGRENLFSFHLYNTTGSWQSGGIYVYDIDKRQVTRISVGRESSGFNKDSLFFGGYDLKIDSINPESIYYGEDFNYPLYYNFKEHKYGHMWKMTEITKKIENFVDLRASDTHVLMTVYFDKYGTDARIMYTKIGEWDKWKELTYKKDTLYGLDRRAGYGNMTGQYIVYYDYDLEVQFCDLELGDAGCFRVSRAGEEARYPYFFNDKNTIYYFSRDMSDTSNASIIKADITDRDNIKYSVILKRNNVPGAWINNIDDRFILFTEKRITDGKEGKALQCYYRFSDKKVFCMDGEFDLNFEKRVAYAYKRMYIYGAETDLNAVSRVLAVRDMECYCDYNPDKCPFEDYTPNPENPKDPWKRPFKK